MATCVCFSRVMIISWFSDSSLGIHMVKKVLLVLDTWRRKMRRDCVWHVKLASCFLLSVPTQWELYLINQLEEDARETDNGDEVRPQMQARPTFIDALYVPYDWWSVWCVGALKWLVQNCWWKWVKQILCMYIWGSECVENDSSCSTMQWTKTLRKFSQIEADPGLTTIHLFIYCSFFVLV